MPNTVIDELLQAAEVNQAHFPGVRALVPTRHVAIVTCMDSRIDVFAIFGLKSGQVHLIRNAGGLATTDVLRSLVNPQRELRKTREIILMHHTKCGLCNMDENAMRQRIRNETGMEPPYPFGVFSDLDQAVRNAVKIVTEHPFLPYRDRIRGCVYDVDTGSVREVGTA